MRAGNRPADGGHLIINSQEEYEDFIRKEPKAVKFVKRYMMGNEFIKNRSIRKPSFEFENYISQQLR